MIENVCHVDFQCLYVIGNTFLAYTLFQEVIYENDCFFVLSFFLMLIHKSITNKVSSCVYFVLVTKPEWFQKHQPTIHLDHACFVLLYSYKRAQLCAFRNVVIHYLFFPGYRLNHYFMFFFIFSLLGFLFYLYYKMHHFTASSLRITQYTFFFQ